MDCSTPGLPVPPGVLPSSCPLNWWCSPIISFSAALVSFCLQSFPELGSFLVSWLPRSGGQIIGASASASVFRMNIQSWFPLGLTGLISWLSKGLLRVFSNTTIWKHPFFGAQPSLWSGSYLHTWLLEIPSLWLYGCLLAKWSLLFNMLCRFVIIFLPRSKHFLISWMQSVSTVILEPKKRKICHCFHLFPFNLHEMMPHDIFF